MLTYKVREYAAAAKLITPKGRIMDLVVAIEHEINMISAIRFDEGGAAMLAAHIINHIIETEGANRFNPLFIRSLRELDV